MEQSSLIMMPMHKFELTPVKSHAGNPAALGCSASVQTLHFRVEKLRMAAGSLSSFPDRLCALQVENLSTLALC